MRTFSFNSSGTTATVYDVRSYGAVADANYFNIADRKFYKDSGFTQLSTNSTAGIQAALDACFAAGGGKVFIPKGKYWIGSGLRTSVNGVNPNCQIFIPVSNSGSTTNCRIEIEGEQEGSFAGYSGLVSVGQSFQGTCLFTTATGSGVKPSVFGTMNQGGLYGFFNYNTIVMKKVRVVLCVNSSNSVVMGGINMENASNFMGDELVVTPNIVPFDTTIPLATTIGICMPKESCNNINVLRNTTTIGTYNGVITGEHTVFENVTAICHVNAFLTQRNLHSNMFNRVSAHWCKNQLLGSGVISLGLDVGQSYLNIMQFDVEWKVQSKWYDSEYFVNDPNNYLKGFMYYHILEGSNGVRNNYFNKVGGLNLVCNTLTAPYQTAIDYIMAQINQPT